MGSLTSKFDHVIAKIDEINSNDPNKELIRGASEPHELIDSKRLTDWIFKLNPNPSEILQIAARGQHIARWMIPRDQYEKTRVGYLLWRENLKKFHASKVSEIMKQAGYSDSDIEKVSAIILKKNLRTDPDVQTLEDALCLVFLEMEFESLRSKTQDEKMKEIVRKTWKKMSPQAQQIALTLPLSKSSVQLIQSALQI